MAQTGNTPDPSRRYQNRIRNRILTVGGLLVVILLLVSFLFNYPGFHNWERIDTNLSMFVAVNVNIVVLATVFYMILRNLFKLIYERKNLMSGVGLKTKLIIAFVALSLPSTAFHLMASGFMGYLFENLFQGEHQQVLDGSRVVMNALENRQDQLLRLTAEDVLGYLPRTTEAVKSTDWFSGYEPRIHGGVFVYDANRELLTQWISAPEILGAWKPPPPQYFNAPEGYYWKEASAAGTLQRLLLPIPNSPDGLKMEVVEMPTPEVAAALRLLVNKQLNNPFITGDLYWLMISVLVSLTLLIIFAATWIAIYLARGFVKPIERLAAATERVADGELGMSVDSRTMGPLAGDFQGLVNSFNSMSRQLKDKQQQLTKTAEDLQQSHQELGERNRLVELLLENVDVGILSLSPQGDITAVNRAVTRLLQPRVEPVLSRHYSVVMGREVSVLLEGMLERLRSGKAPEVTQNLTLSHNRKSTHIEFTVLQLENAEGASEGVVVMVKDVTSIQRTQRALAWREVARRIAHEIKNPLTPIQVQADRIRRKYVNGNGDGEDLIDQSTRTIINEVSTLKKMVNEFSEFAKLPECQPVLANLNNVIREMAPLYKNGLPESIRLDLLLEDDLPSFPLDSEQIRRAFTNLVDNAAAAVQKGGTITVRTAYDAENEIVTAEVEDDGPGVPEAMRPRLFEPYTTTKAGGTGLGLAIVNQIISDHNAEIRYSERKPSGSIFIMEFPLR